MLLLKKILNKWKYLRWYRWRFYKHITKHSFVYTLGLWLFEDKIRSEVMAFYLNEFFWWIVLTLGFIIMFLVAI